MKRMKESTGIIYMYTQKGTDKKYIGQTTRPDRRMWEHKTATHCKNTKIDSAIRKYGIEAFEYEVLESGIDSDDLNEKERYYIEKHNTWIGKNPNGMNLTPGGFFDRDYRKWLKETDKWKESNKRSRDKLKADPEWQLKMAEKNRAMAKTEKWKESHKKAMKERSDNPVWRNRIEAAAAKRAMDTEWKKNNKVAMKKRAQDPEWRKAHAIRMQARYDDPEFAERQANTIRAMVKTPEWKEKQAAGAAKRATAIYCVEDKKVYKGFNSASRELGYSTGNLYNAVKKGWACGGKHYRYATEEEQAVNK